MVGAPSLTTVFWDYRDHQLCLTGDPDSILKLCNGFWKLGKYFTCYIYFFSCRPLSLASRFFAELVGLSHLPDSKSIIVVYVPHLLQHSICWPLQGFSCMRSVSVSHSSFIQDLGIRFLVFIFSHVGGCGWVGFVLKGAYRKKHSPCPWGVNTLWTMVDVLLLGFILLNWPAS